MRGAILLIILSVTGCSAHWTKPGASRHDFERDHHECDQQAYQFGYVYSENRYQECMTARGYTVR